MLSECFTYIHLFKIHNNYYFHFAKENVKFLLENCEDHEAGCGELGFEPQVLGGSPKLESESWLLCADAAAAQSDGSKADSEAGEIRQSSLTTLTKPSPHFLFIPSRRLTKY